MTEYIIVGGGPTGMTIAWELLKKSPRPKITIIDAASSLGGVHRVNRAGPDNAFAEHGPRVYSTSFINFRRVMKEIAAFGAVNVNGKVVAKYRTDPEKIFAPYKIQVRSVVRMVLTALTVGESLCFANSFMLFVLGFDYTRVSVEDYMRGNNFSAASIAMVNSQLLATDGAGVRNYSMNKFFQLFNQEIVYDLVQPVAPNDVGFVGEWGRALTDSGVNIVLNTKVSRIECSVSVGKNTSSVVTKIDGRDTAATVVMAIPPQLLQKIEFVDTFGNPIDPFGMSARKQWVIENTYSDYVCIAFSWKDSLTLAPLHDTLSKRTAHGLLVVPMSDYFGMDVDGMTGVSGSSEKNNINMHPFRTIISTSMSLPGDMMIHSANKNYAEVIRVAWVELQEVYAAKGTKLPMYDFAAVGSDTNVEPAYIRGVKFPEAMPMKSSVSNLVTVGPHTNTTGYAFTSIESAVASGLIYTSSCEEFRFTFVILFLLIVVLVIMIAAGVKYVWNRGDKSEEEVEV